MTIDDDIAATAREADDKFDALQPALVASFRAHGVTDDQMHDAIAYAHSEYWRTRGEALARLRVALERDGDTSQ